MMPGKAPSIPVRDLASVLPVGGKPWWRTSYLLILNVYIFSLILFSSTSGYDISLMNGLQSLGQWQQFMNSPTGAWLGFINALQSIGGLVFQPISAWSANRFGRKRTILIGYLWLVLGVGLQAGAPNLEWFIASRFFIGVASTWFQASVILVTEIAYPSHRSFVTAAYMCFFYAGSLLSAWIAFGTRNLDSNWAWRIPSLMQIALPLLALPGTLLIPESPRWLICQKRSEEASIVLVRYHAGGDRNSELVAFEMAEITESINLEQSVQRESRWRDCVSTKGNRYRLFLSVSLGFFAQWNGCGVVSYYLTLILKTIGIASVTEQTLINGFLQLWNLIMSIVGACLVDRAGRRKLFLTSTLIMLTSYIFITALSGSFSTTGTAAIGTAVIPFLFIYFAGYDIAFTPLLLAYPAEIWTFSLRAKGVALSMVANYVALIFNQLINPIALEAIAWKYYIVFLVILIVILGTVYFCYPETKGYSLEEIAVIFDGEKARVTDFVTAKEGINDERGGKSEHAEKIIS